MAGAFYTENSGYFGIYKNSINLLSLFQNRADCFLHRVREAAAAEARRTNRLEVLIELAAEVGWICYTINTQYGCR